MTLETLGSKGEVLDDGPVVSQVEPNLRETLVTLSQFDTARLRAEWRRLYRAEAPRLSRDLLVRGVAHRLQEGHLGAMSKATRRKLAAFAKELAASGSLAPTPNPQLRAGSRLVREWHGRTHTVAVLEDGFEYNGTIYRSLTKIAREITGAHWSGPRFFGLTGASGSRGAVGDGDSAKPKQRATAAEPESEDADV